MNATCGIPGHAKRVAVNLRQQFSLPRLRITLLDPLDFDVHRRKTKNFLQRCNVCQRDTETCGDTRHRHSMTYFERVQSMTFGHRMSLLGAAPLSLGVVPTPAAFAEDTGETDAVTQKVKIQANAPV